MTNSQKFNILPVASPIDTNRKECNEEEVRNERGICSLCGEDEVGKGFDVYANLSFWQPLSGSTSVNVYSHYVGYLKVLFCDRCVSKNSVHAACSRMRKWLILWISACVTSAIVFLVLLVLDNMLYPVAWVLPLIFLFAIAFCNGALNPKKAEHNFYKRKVEKYVEDNDKALRESLKLPEVIVPSKHGFVNPFEPTLKFEIEPSKTGTGVWTDDEGIKWMGRSLHSSLLPSIFSKDRIKLSSLCSK